MKPRKNLWARVEALESKQKPKDIDLTKIMFGDISVWEISKRLLKPEMEDFWQALRDLEEFGNDDQARLVLDALIELAKERREEGLIVIRECRSLSDMFQEMKTRQKQGEKIFYGDIEQWDVYLGREDSQAA